MPHGGPPRVAPTDESILTRHEAGSADPTQQVLAGVGTFAVHHVRRSKPQCLDHNRRMSAFHGLRGLEATASRCRLGCAGEHARASEDP
mgnify:CR=1 FL=1